MAQKTRVQHTKDEIKVGVPVEFTNTDDDTSWVSTAKIGPTGATMSTADKNVTLLTLNGPTGSTAFSVTGGASASLGDISSGSITSSGSISAEGPISTKSSLIISDKGTITIGPTGKRTTLTQSSITITGTEGTVNMSPSGISVSGGTITGPLANTLTITMNGMTAGTFNNSSEDSTPTGFYAPTGAGTGPTGSTPAQVLISTGENNAPTWTDQYGLYAGHLQGPTGSDDWSGTKYSAKLPSGFKSTESNVDGIAVTKKFSTTTEYETWKAGDDYDETVLALTPAEDVKVTNATHADSADSADSATLAKTLITANNRIQIQETGSDAKAAGYIRMIGPTGAGAYVGMEIRNGNSTALLNDFRINFYNLSSYRSSPTATAAWSFTNGSSHYGSFVIGPDLTNEGEASSRTLQFYPYPYSTSASVTSSLGVSSYPWTNIYGTTINGTTIKLGSTSVTGALSISGPTGGVSISPTAISVTGTVTATSFNATSDERLKEDITDYEYHDSILDIPVKEYTYKDSGLRTIGFIAQDLQKEYPEMVDENDEGYLSIRSDKLFYLLLEETKSLKARIAALEEELKRRE